MNRDILALSDEVIYTVARLLQTEIALYFELENKSNK